MKYGKRRTLEVGQKIRGMKVTNPYLRRDRHDKVMVEIECHCGRTHVTRRSGLTTPNRHLQTKSCGCLAKKALNEMIDKRVRKIPERIREVLAAEGEMFPSFRDRIETAFHFRITGKLAVYVINRIRKQWREDIWQYPNPSRMTEICKHVVKRGIYSTRSCFLNEFKVFTHKLAVIKAVVAWAKRNIPGANQQPIAWPSAKNSRLQRLNQNRAKTKFTPKANVLSFRMVRNSSPARSPALSTAS